MDKLKSKVRRVGRFVKVRFLQHVALFYAFSPWKRCYPRALTGIMCNFGSDVSAMSGFSLFTRFCTFNLLSLMFRHDRVMLQIKNLLIAGAVEISFVSYDGNML